MKTISGGALVVVCPSNWTERQTSESSYIQAPPLSVTLVTNAPPPLPGDLPDMLLITLTPSPKVFADVCSAPTPLSVSDAPPNPVFKDLYTLRNSV